MKRVDGWIEQEVRRTPGGGWATHRTFDPNISVEQARQSMELEQKLAHEDTELRLVYVRVETTREVLD